MVSDNTLIWLGEILLFSIAMTPVFLITVIILRLHHRNGKRTAAAFFGLSQANVQAAF